MSTVYFETHIKPTSPLPASVDVQRVEPLMDEVRNFVDGISDDFWRTIESHFRRLTHRMLFGDSSLRRWEESDDIVQSSMLRLYACLRSVNVESELHLLRLVALQIRRELADVSRRYMRSNCLVANYESFEGDPPTVAVQPEAPELYQWAEFHRSVGELPENARSVFELKWYVGLTLDQVAEQMNVSPRQCQGHLRQAKMLIARRVDAHEFLH